MIHIYILTHSRTPVFADMLACVFKQVNTLAQQIKMKHVCLCLCVSVCKHSRTCLRF